MKEKKTTKRHGEKYITLQTIVKSGIGPADRALGTVKGLE